MKLAKLIFEGVTPADAGKATEELFQMLKQHGKAMLPTGQQVTMEGLARVALRTSIDSYLQDMGDKVTGIEGVELDIRKVPAVKFAYSETEKDSQEKIAQGQRDMSGKD